MKAVYIHIPFCKSICSYCDFCKVFYYPKWSYAYLKALKEEIDDVYMGEEVQSIYIGGGTPSSLSCKEIDYLFYFIKKFKRASFCEVTFECNLEDITDDLLKVLKKNKVNRLSIGIESFQDQNLCLLGRNHSFQDAKEKMKKIRSYGFSNVNLDLIYAISKESLKMVKDDLRLFLKLKPDHISTYSLMIEPHTILAHQHIKPIQEEIDRKMYDTICATLKRKGYLHYEVSNFAKKGKESRHNLTYWNNEEYYGFGLSASGYLGNVRYTNTKNLFAYLKGNRKGESQILDQKEKMDHEVMLGLRKLKGINVAEFEKKYQIKMSDAYPLTPLLKQKDLTLKKGYLAISDDKIYVMNEILAKMI